MIVESWFAERSVAAARARVLAFYNVVYYVAFTAGIALLSLKPSSNDIFTLAAILVMAAMLPVALTRLNAPQLPQRVSLPRLLAVAPLALVGNFIAGLLVNGFFTMASVFLLQQGFSLRQIAFYLMIAMITGFAVRLPIARFSDRYGRRRAILVCAILAAAGALTGLGLMMAGIRRVAALCGGRFIRAGLVCALCLERGAGQ